MRLFRRKMASGALYEGLEVAGCLLEAFTGSSPTWSAQKLLLPANATCYTANRNSRLIDAAVYHQTTTIAAASTSVATLGSIAVGGQDRMLH
jgi:hypothetical protein